MLLLKARLFTIIAACLIMPFCAGAQIDDIGLWVGASVNKKITREFEGSLAAQYRFDHDITAIDVFLADVGVQYDISKKFKAGIHYRFINSNHENYYSKRHRFYINLAFKQKFKFITFIIRERLQEQYTDVYSSDNGKIPAWTLRSKLMAKFDLNKKYEPYIAGEIYYIVDNAKEEDRLFSRNRYEAGFTYEFNRVHSVNPFVLFQHSRLTGYNQLVYGITYDYNF